MSASNASIHPDTTVGKVALTVPDLDRSVPFYQQVVGLQLHKREAGTAILGAGGQQEIVELSEDANARPARSTTGLYHLAIRVSSRLELARALRRLVEAQYPPQGFADHLVSEAIYLADPDGNGIEIYRDRDRSEWPYRNGQLQMATDPLDVQGLLAELESETGLPAYVDPATNLGHVHLQVNQIPQAEAFYCDVLGFELVTRYGPSASFVSAGGYHHHIGFNTWNSAGAPSPPPGSTGLRYFSVLLPHLEELERVAGRVRSADIPTEETDNGLLVYDPAGNGVLLTV